MAQGRILAFMRRGKLPGLACALLAFGLAPGARADPAAEDGPRPTPPAGSQQTGELWLNPGFYAHHFQKNRNLRSDVYGFGGEYRYSPSAALTAGYYHNSNWGVSHYLAYYWRPLALGPMRFGAVLGAVDGYPGTRKGGWFPVALPTASVESGRIGLNIFYIPSVGNSVNGSITFQVNIRVY